MFIYLLLAKLNTKKQYTPIKFPCNHNIDYNVIHWGAFIQVTVTTSFKKQSLHIVSQQPRWGVRASVYVGPCWFGITPVWCSRSWARHRCRVTQARLPGSLISGLLFRRHTITALSEHPGNACGQSATFPEVLIHHWDTNPAVGHVQSCTARILSQIQNRKTYTQQKDSNHLHRHPCFNQQSGRYVGLHTALLRCSYRRLLCCVLNYWSPLSCLLWSNTPLNDISLQTHPLDFYFQCKKGKCLLYLFFFIQIPKILNTWH